MIRTPDLAKELIDGEIEVIDLPNSTELLESVDKALLVEYKDKFDSGLNLNKISKIRKKLLDKISEIKKSNWE